MSKKCASCGLVNPDTVEECACGYNLYYEDLIELFSTDNGIMGAECSNKKCGYQGEEIYVGLGACDIPFGFRVPGYCETCKKVVSISDASPKCKFCDGEVKRYVLSEDKLNESFCWDGDDFCFAHNLCCPKCGENTLNLFFQPNATWD